ncbi:MULTISPECIES: 3-phosphoshikimate 1-carboxyvinyltransferase [unclassified Helicobacter]|uniref:3-phosphoshikimate 1-carboxyvinyltransferase n=1 Tax=unclassified Helicobacter TaxID=2593540 RepID=UPI000CF19795|nr:MULTISPECIES: 3-phosphoshikimate 1-carboxyvinyltransferase [unclassified Helicobacter]
MKILKAKSVRGELDNIAPDKSISHRCVIFSLLASSTSEIKNFLLAKDTLSSLNIAKQLGLKVEKKKDILLFIPPKEGIREPVNILNCGNAGTAMRLYMGLLAGNNGHFVLNGDQSLRNRPMDRLIKPLQDIGAKIKARKEDRFAPISIVGSKLRDFSYKSGVASAQVKSAMILAGLFSEGKSYFKEPYLSRDHTERMLQGMGASLKNKDNGIYITPLKKPLEPLILEIPSDPSSAFFFAVAGVILPNSHLVLKNVLLNPTRIEAFEVLKKMGAKISYEITQDSYELVGNITVQSSQLNAITLNKNIAWLIDEIPALSIAMASAKGTSIIKNAKELRIKETDRIQAIVKNLKKMHIEAEEFEDGFSIKGGEFYSAKVDSFGDHRIAMSFAIAGLKCGVEIRNFKCVDISFPNFLEILNKITKG